MRATWMGCLLIVVGSVPALQAAEIGVAEGIAERMTREAIAAGAAGDMALRDDLLADAVRTAPDHGPARWARGEMEVDGEWQSIAAIQDAARTSEPLAEYQQLKAQASNTARDHLQLARWCRSNQLDDEARYHWLAVLSVDDDNREALRALDSVWVDGELVSRNKAADERLPPYKVRRQNREWRGRIAGWERALAAGGDEATRALAELDAEVDESAIVEFEKLAAGRRGATGATSDRHLELCKAFVRAMGHLPTYEASESLVRFAILANDESLRAAAAAELVDRPEHEVVPQLISGLGSEIESRIEFSRSATGRVSLTHELFAEGAASNQSVEISKSATPQLALRGDENQGQLAQAAQRAESRMTGRLNEFWSDALRLHNLAEQENAARKEMNARIIPILRQLTGKDLGDKPTAWWDYWRDHNGYESYRPTEQYRTSLTYTEPIRPSCECFAAGTLVWTKSGMQAIETLAAGDLVLTMDVETGERCFRPVLDTTRRPPSKLMHIAVGEYQLLATPGHPFWVEGAGWKMAKELSSGDYIATAAGTPLVVRVLASSEVEEEAFNLVVEDNSNYFVGVDGLLSHDNTPRKPELERMGKW